jgi:hypothetical protein
VTSQAPDSPIQADEFGQYTWARRHTKDAWRERYRKNRDRLDERIADIVKEDPPVPNEKGRYKFRRHGRTDQDDELNADDDGLERGDSATDNEDDPVQSRRIYALRQEEEDDDDEEQAAAHQSVKGPSHLNQDARHEEEEEAEEAAVSQPKARPRTRAATRQSRALRVEAPTPKRRRTVSPLSFSVSGRLRYSPIRRVHHKLWRNKSLAALMRLD